MSTISALSEAAVAAAAPNLQTRRSSGGRTRYAPKCLRKRTPCLHVVASGTAAVQEEVRKEPLTKLDLVNHLASGCKPRSKWRIGAEHEKFGFDLATLKPLDYDQIRKLLERMGERLKWSRTMEDEYLVGLKCEQDGQSVTLEPGGQVEHGGSQATTLHQATKEVEAHLKLVREVGEELGFGFLGTGFIPKWRVEDIALMPRGRYRVMQEYLPSIGNTGPDIMYRTCTVQVNLDFSSEEDMVRKMRVALSLQPIATAIFASSPFTEGAPNGFLSYRSHLYDSVDLKSERTQPGLPFVFKDGFGFEDIVNHALDVPMFFAYRNNKYIDCCGLSFRDFLEGKLEKLPGEYPTLADWENHLSCIYPDVRERRYLEMRGADSGPKENLIALPAFWVGLLYDQESLDKAYDMIEDWTQKERNMLRIEVPRTGLKTPFRGKELLHLARDVYDLSVAGLERRGHGEAVYLESAKRILSNGVTLAEELLDLYHGKWKGNIDHIYEELRF